MASAFQKLATFRREGHHWLLIGTAQSGEVVSLEPFDAVSFPFDVLFPLDDAPPASST